MSTDPNRISILAAALAGFLLCSCGQKGPLFLPGDRRDVQTELPELSRGSLEEAARDEEAAAPVVPDTGRPEAEGDEAEPFVDPASPPPDADAH